MSSTPEPVDQKKPSRVDRVVNSFSGGQKILVALTSLIVAAAGVWAALQSFTGGPVAGNAVAATPDSGHLAEPQPSVSAPGAVLESEPNVTLPDGSGLGFTDSATGVSYIQSFESIGQLDAGNGSQIALLPAGQQRDYENCLNADFGQSIDTNQLLADDTICVTTPQRRMVVMKVLPRNTDTTTSLHFDITIYQEK